MIALKNKNTQHRKNARVFLLFSNKNLRERPGERQ